ncbi:hypothetical protein DPQ25_05245 [Hydrogeniiclostridium mannosilyticum]|uniref:Uncharacterized protein n=1 Tax=Hydrogeniiclostridium mannosilyticum TaxID=2764322 RepID=A0A328UJJ7_9FIRM|nr:hypothetical protein DPQ25_05245 [Hydrogeniiclostridium mannosilyticum]
MSPYACGQKGDKKPQSPVLYTGFGETAGLSALCPARSPTVGYLKKLLTASAPMTAKSTNIILSTQNSTACTGRTNRALRHIKLRLWQQQNAAGICPA